MGTVLSMVGSGGNARVPPVFQQSSCSCPLCSCVFVLQRAVLSVSAPSHPGVQPLQVLSPPVTVLSGLAPSQMEKHCALGISLCSPVQGWDGSTIPHYVSVLLNLCTYSGLPMHKSTEQPQNKKRGKYSQAFCLNTLLVGTFIPVMGTSWIKHLQEQRAALGQGM